MRAYFNTDRPTFKEDCHWQTMIGLRPTAFHSLAEHVACVGQSQGGLTITAQLPLENDLLNNRGPSPYSGGDLESTR